MNEYEIRSKKLILPAILYFQKRVSAVYKIHFNEYFYIGSSMDLNYRVYRHIYKIKNDYTTKAIKRAFEKCTSIEVEIIEEIQDELQLRKKEEKLLKENNDNLRCLNVFSKAMLSNTRIRKVNLYSPSGDFLRQYDSLAKVAVALGTTRQLSHSVKMGHKVKGHTLRLVGDNGEEL